MQPAAFLGVDLAWGPRSRTGLAALDERGRLCDLAERRTDEEIVAWLRRWTDRPCLVGIDAPLVVTNPTGARRCERELNAVFRRYDAGAHPSNTGRPVFADGGRGRRLAARLGLDIDPDSSGARRALEVYPHPATVVLFRLGRTLKYKHKPGRDLESLRQALQRLTEHLAGLVDADPPLVLGHCRDWARVERQVATATRKSGLREVEDVVDAVVCAYVALLRARHPERTTVFGDLATGYIVTPTLPADHPPPAPRAHTR
jgi:predicted RNase H-like nuclease